MLGVPDCGFVFDRTNIILGAADEEYVPGDRDPLTALLTAGGELADLMRELAAVRAKDPADDLVTALSRANIDGEALTPDELASFFTLPVVAGNETTRNTISHGLRPLTEHPEQRARWLSDFERYAAGAVDEIVRMASPVVWMRRTAVRDTELGGAGSPTSG